MEVGSFVLLHESQGLKLIVILDSKHLYLVIHLVDLDGDGGVTMICYEMIKLKKKYNIKNKEEICKNLWFWK